MAIQDNPRKRSEAISLVIVSVPKPTEGVDEDILEQLSTAERFRAAVYAGRFHFDNADEPARNELEEWITDRLQSFADDIVRAVEQEIRSRLER